MKLVCGNSNRPLAEMIFDKCRDKPFLLENDEYPWRSRGRSATNNPRDFHCTDTCQSDYAYCPRAIR